MTGYTAEEAIGRTPRILKSGEQAPEVYTALWNTILAGKVWRGEFMNRRKDGQLYAEEQTITPVRGPRGDITHFVAIKNDVTERKRIIEALWHSEAHYRSLIENALDIILVIDAEGLIRYASPALERVLGWRPEERTGTSAFELLHPDDFAAMETMFREGATTPGLVQLAELRGRHRDGTWRTLEAAAKALFDDPTIAGTVINARDITERKRAEAIQQRLRQQLSQSEKLAAMGELLAGVAHELNNPLSVVMGFTALLKSETTDTRVAARADKISQATERCGRIVKNFLALARQHPPERERVDLNALVREVTELLAYPLRLDNIVVGLELADNVPPISADPHQLQQALVNLLTNAHHAMREVQGLRRLSITSRFDTEALRVSLEVADTGPGIPPEVEARIFEPFFTTKPVEQGTGLGLSICKGIIESHGGSLTVDGRPGRGALFRIELPDGLAPHPGVPTSPGSRPALGRKGVLVVDDERDVANVLSEMLSEQGHDVTQAANGLEALRRLEERTYDVILADIRMPELDGPGLYREIGRRQPNVLGRFAFVTGDVLSPGTSEFLDRNRVPHLKKPFTSDEIEAVLRKVLEPEPGPQ